MSPQCSILCCHATWHWAAAAAGDENMPQPQAAPGARWDGWRVAATSAPSPVCTKGERMPCEPQQRARDHSWEESLESCSDLKQL